MFQTSWNLEFYDPQASTVKVDEDGSIHHLVLAAIMDGCNGRPDVHALLRSVGIRADLNHIGYVMRQLRDEGYLVHVTTGSRSPLNIPERAKIVNFTAEDIAFIRSQPRSALKELARSRYNCSAFALRQLKAKPKKEG